MSEFVKYLPEEVSVLIAQKKMKGILQNGLTLENAEIWPDTWRGHTYKSLRGVAGGHRYSWPKCGCGVKMLIKAENI